MKKLLIILILFTGCNYKELNNMAIVTGIYINYSNQYEIDIMVSKDKNTLYHTKGKTIKKALDNLTISKQLYLGHLDILIINEKALKKINSITNYFNNNYEVSKNFYLMISKNNILKNLAKLDPFPFNKISLINTSDDDLTYDKFIQNILKNKESYVPIVKYKDNYLTTKKSILIKGVKL